MRETYNLMGTFPTASWPLELTGGTVTQEKTQRAVRPQINFSITPLFVFRLGTVQQRKVHSCGGLGTIDLAATQRPNNIHQVGLSLNHLKQELGQGPRLGALNWGIHKSWRFLK